MPFISAGHNSGLYSFNIIKCAYALISGTQTRHSLGVRAHIVSSTHAHVKFLMRVRILFLGVRAQAFCTPELFSSAHVWLPSNAVKRGLWGREWWVFLRYLSGLKQLSYEMFEMKVFILTNVKPGLSL